MIRAHRTHVKGGGSNDLDSGAERRRIRVTLATGISEERCRRVNLGYLDPRTVEVGAWEGREAAGVLVVRNAGVMLYRARDVSWPVGVRGGTPFGWCWWPRFRVKAWVPAEAPSLRARIQSPLPY